jgi:hypothetical protein
LLRHAQQLWAPGNGALGRLADYKVDTYWTETGSKDANISADVKGGGVLKSGLKRKRPGTRLSPPLS